MLDLRLSTLARFACLFTAALLIVMGIVSKRGWLDWRRMCRRNAELSAKIDELRREKAGLERRTVALQSDPAEQQRVVRDVLGYVRPDETVIEFP